MWSLNSTAPIADPAHLALAQQSFHKLLSRKDLGFFKVLERSALWESSYQRAQELRKTYQKLIVIGIGGSSLGGRAFLQACQDEMSPDLSVEFFDNVDSHRFQKRLEAIPLERPPHWLIISKSGNTIETLNTANFVDQYLATKGMRLRDHCTVVTESKENPLYQWAQKESVAQLDLPQDIGGRFSIFTPVGLLPMAFAGLPLENIKKGIERALQDQELVTQFSALAYQSFQQNKWISVFWPYCDDLTQFGLWTMQLWAESLGKKMGRDSKPAQRASTPVSYLGASDQHSVLQQVAEGALDKWIVFIAVDRSETSGPRLKSTLFPRENLLVGKTMGELLSAERKATTQALAEQGRASVTLSTESLTSESSAQLFMLLMLAVGTLGEMLNINAFDQPGVEAGKVLAKDLLRG